MPSTPGVHLRSEVAYRDFFVYIALIYMLRELRLKNTPFKKKSWVRH